jgi:hypothetical protein
MSSATPLGGKLQAGLRRGPGISYPGLPWSLSPADLPLRTRQRRKSVRPDPDPENDVQPPDEASLLSGDREEAAPTPPPGSGRRSCGPVTLAGCILIEALTLLFLVAFCSTLVGVSFLRQAVVTSPGTATPAAAELVTPEPSPTETETPAPPTPTVAPATPTLAAPAVTATGTSTPSPTATPRRFAVFLPLAVRAPLP